MQLRFDEADGAAGGTGTGAAASTVHVPEGTALGLGSVIELGGFVFSNNGSSAAAMPTPLKQRAWEDLGEALRSKGLAMVLAYWAQGRTTMYKRLDEWDTFWLNGECERRREPSPGGRPYPWKETMAWGCISGVRVTTNPAGSSPPASSDDVSASVAAAKGGGGTSGGAAAGGGGDGSGGGSSAGFTIGLLGVGGAVGWLWYHSRRGRGRMGDDTRGQGMGRSGLGPPRLLPQQEEMHVDAPELAAAALSREERGLAVAAEEAGGATCLERGRPTRQPCGSSSSHEPQAEAAGIATGAMSGGLQPKAQEDDGIVVRI